MNVARLAPLAQPWPPAIADILSRYPQGPEGPIGLFRTLAHSERTLRKLGNSGVLDRESPISLRHREILILRTSANCRCSYEWGVHVSIFAAKARLSPAQIADTAAANPDSALWSEDDLLLLRLADALHYQNGIDDSLWQAIGERWNIAQLLEMLLTCGFYHTIAYFNNALRIEQEPGTPMLPGHDSRNAASGAEQHTT